MSLRNVHVDNNPFRTIIVNDHTTITDIKRQIKEEEKVPSGEERLIFVYNNTTTETVEDEVLESLKRTLQSLHTSEQIGQDIIVELNDQGYKIEKMQRDVETLEENNKQSELHLNSIKHFFGRVLNKFSLSKLTKRESQVKPSGEQAGDEILRTPLQAGSETPRTPLTPNPTSELGSFDTTIQEQDDNFDRIYDDNFVDEYLDEIGSVLSRLQNMGMDMNKELDDQNARLKNLEKKVETERLNIEKNTREINKLL